MKKSLWLLPLVLLLVIVGAVMGVRNGIGPVRQETLAQPHIYAYRDWQSTGLMLHTGDRVYIRARGTWLYTPGEYHGPEGHAKYRAPNTYPIPAIPGGILLGRIGDAGQPFAVGRGRTVVADREGLLYLRINDDILSDNAGYVEVEITVTPYEASE
ncbi:MAG TPA: hypothetical protein PKL16_07685 [Anaerolineae bacterium]|nr:hypothetical protein [Anaerolineae bacterium]HOS80097.1 hypothetical protein [Anaerolineae bacterium]HQM14268.1 hypothetical protein [Anaerolineae bacterium]